MPEEKQVIVTSEKLINVLTMILPLVAAGAAILRNRDSNNTGPDDEVAALLEHVIERTSHYEFKSQ